MPAAEDVVGVVPHQGVKQIAFAYYNAFRRGELLPEKAKELESLLSQDSAAHIINEKVGALVGAISPEVSLLVFAEKLKCEPLLEALCKREDVWALAGGKKELTDILEGALVKARVRADTSGPEGCFHTVRPFSTVTPAPAPPAPEHSR